MDFEKMIFWAEETGLEYIQGSNPLLSWEKVKKCYSNKSYDVMLMFNRKLRAGLSLSTEEYARVAIGGMLRRWMHNEKVELGAHLKRRLQEDLLIFTKCRLNFSHLNPAY